MNAYKNKYNRDTFDITSNRFSDILCKDCKHAKPDFVVNGKVVLTGYTNTYCQKYSEQEKPIEITLGKSMDCKFFEQK